MSDQIGKRLAAIRRDRRMSEATLAAAIGVSKGLIWHYEHGLTDVPTSRLVDLARVLHCRTDDIVMAPVEAPMPRVRR
jgi:transcriptional regulator with XRE-family HTH domain